MSNEALDWAFRVDVRRSADKLVLLALADAANEHWACFPGKDEIAAKASCAETSVVHCTRRLEEGGHLVRIAFEAPHGQDQKIGYVLAGGGRLESLDEEFLCAAFAKRKLDGRPRLEKPKHWAGGRKSDAAQQSFGQGDQSVTLPGQGDQLVTPRGDCLVTPRTQRRTPSTTKISDPADAGSSPVDADASTICGAAAPRDEDDRSVRRSPKRRQTLGAYLKTLGADAVDEIYWDLDSSRGGVLSWAEPRARKELGIPPGDDWPEGELDDALTLKVVEIALNTLRKRSYAEFGDVAEGYLDGFEWPPEKDGPQSCGSTADAQLRFRHSPGFLYPGRGHEDDCLASIRAAIDRMPPSELAESLGLFAAHRPEILARCRGGVDGSALRDDDAAGRQTLHAGAEYYRDQEKVKWPKFIVPRELHPGAKAAAA